MNERMKRKEVILERKGNSTLSHLSRDDEHAIHFSICISTLSVTLSHEKELKWTLLSHLMWVSLWCYPECGCVSFIYARERDSVGFKGQIVYVLSSHNSHMRIYISVKHLLPYNHACEIPKDVHKHFRQIKISMSKAVVCVSFRITAYVYTSETEKEGSKTEVIVVGAESMGK